MIRKLSSIRPSHSGPMPHSRRHPTGRARWRPGALLPALLMLPLMLVAGRALAQPDAEDRTFERAGEIASQPARDVGAAKQHKIPPILQQAVTAPYRAASAPGCAGLVAELNQLNTALGADFDADKKGNEDKLTKLAVAGGEMVVGSLIPFRGIVREVSGAAAADRRMAVAINAGLARRGYLRGVAELRGCKVPTAPPKPAK